MSWRGNNVAVDTREAHLVRCHGLGDWHWHGIHICSVAFDVVIEGTGEDQVIAVASDNRVAARVDATDTGEVLMQGQR